MGINRSTGEAWDPNRYYGDHEVVVQCSVVRIVGAVRFEIVAFLPPKHARLDMALEHRGVDGVWEPGWRVRAIYSSIPVDYLKLNNAIGPPSFRAQKETT